MAVTPPVSRRAILLNCGLMALIAYLLASGFVAMNIHRIEARVRIETADLLVNLLYMPANPHWYWATFPKEPPDVVARDEALEDRLRAANGVWQMTPELKRAMNHQTSASRAQVTSLAAARRYREAGVLVAGEIGAAARTDDLDRLERLVEEQAAFFQKAKQLQ